MLKHLIYSWGWYTSFALFLDIFFGVFETTFAQSGSLRFASNMSFNGIFPNVIVLFCVLLSAINSLLHGFLELTNFSDLLFFSSVYLCFLFFLLLGVRKVILLYTQVCWYIFSRLISLSNYYFKELSSFDGFAGYLLIMLISACTVSFMALINAGN